MLEPDYLIVADNGDAREPAQVGRYLILNTARDHLRGGTLLLANTGLTASGQAVLAALQQIGQAGDGRAVHIYTHPSSFVEQVVHGEGSPVAVACAARLKRFSRFFLFVVPGLQVESLLLDEEAFASAALL